MFGKIKEKVIFMDTLSSKRLLLRAFTKDDFFDVIALADNWNSAPGPKWDKFPADERFLEEICTKENYYAVYLREEEKVIGILAINGICENEKLDLGHVIHSDFQNNDIDREALEMMVEHIFATMEVKKIITGNFPYEKQIAPLKSLGFIYKGTSDSSTYEPIKSLGYGFYEETSDCCTYEMEKNDWKKVNKSKNYCT